MERSIKSKVLGGLGIGLVVVALFLFMQIGSLQREYQEIAQINEARAELRLEKANLYRTTGIFFVAGGVICLLFSFCNNKKENKMTQHFYSKIQDSKNVVNQKLSIPKMVLLVAIVLQFATMFLKILFLSNYHDPERGIVITGFYGIDTFYTDTSPITGILNIVWIGINLLFFFKTFNNKLIYNTMQILSLCFLFLIIALPVFLIMSVGEDRIFWYSGIYVLSLSFIAYFIAYLLFVIQNKKTVCHHED